MKMKFLLLAVLFITLGAGCSSSSSLNDGSNLSVIDSSIKIYAQIPKTWIKIKFPTYYKDSKSLSGVSQVPAGLNYGFGMGVDSDTKVVVHVIAIPKSWVDTFEKNEPDANIERKFETSDYVVYTTTVDTVKNNSDVVTFLKTLQYRP